MAATLDVSSSALARLLWPHYARGDDEGRALLREAFTLSGASRSPATPSTSGSTPPAPQDAASPRRPLPRTQRHRDDLPQHGTDPHLQRQGPPDPRINDLTMSGVLESGRAIATVVARASRRGRGSSRWHGRRRTPGSSCWPAVWVIGLPDCTLGTTTTRASPPARLPSGWANRPAPRRCSATEQLT